MECLNKITCKKKVSKLGSKLRNLSARQDWTYSVPMAGTISIPCGQCIACRINKQAFWSSRCYLEHRTASFGQFLTLTYSDEHLPDTEVAESTTRKRMRKFIHALRMRERRASNPMAVRYFGTMEHGDLTDRLHAHLLIWNTFETLFNLTPYKKGLPRPKIHTPLWPWGHIDAMPITMNSIRYVSKYTTKPDFGADEQKASLAASAPRPFVSQRPPLGLTGLKAHVMQLKSSPEGMWLQSCKAITVDGMNLRLDRPWSLKYAELMEDAGISILEGNSEAERAEYFRKQVDEPRSLTQQTKTINSRRELLKKMEQGWQTKEQRRMQVLLRASYFSSRAAKSTTSPNAIPTVPPVSRTE